MAIARTPGSADEVLAQMWQLATFDANQLSQYRRGACRYCWGFGHHYQWLGGVNGGREVNHLRKQARFIQIVDVLGIVNRVVSSEEMTGVCRCSLCTGSMRNQVLLVDELRKRGIHFKSLTDSIDTSSPMGRFIFHIMSALAEMDRELVVERTRSGLAAAREKVRIGGRRPKLTAEQWT